MNRPISQNNILVNGELADSISVYDRGLQYGDGLFETIAVSNGRPLLLEKHLSRLHKSTQYLKFSTQDFDTIKQELLEFSQDIQKGIVKIILTRGAGGRGYALPDEPSANRILIKYPWPDYPNSIISQGAKLRVCDLKLSKQSAFVTSKHLNRLEQILARSEWSDEDIFEGILLNEDDKIIECTMSNVFFIKGKHLITPELNESGVKGILREVILENAELLGYEMIVSSIYLDDLNSKDECFITNSIIGVCPVNTIGDVSYSMISQSQKIREYLLQQNLIADL